MILYGFRRSVSKIMKSFVIGIVGSRRRNTEEDYKKVFLKLEAALFFNSKNPDIKIVSGGCKKGADSFVARLSDETGIPYYEHLPDLSGIEGVFSPQAYKWLYAKACYKRNTLIAQDSDILIACVAADRTGGTEDTIHKFKKIHKGTRRLVLV